jgi:serine/arginine repetitive matrix protein 2
VQRCLDSEAPAKAVTSRARFNSLDSSVVLDATSKNTERSAQVRSASASESPMQDSGLRKDTPHFANLSCPPPEDVHKPATPVPPNSTTGSIAIRAMRSMRSMARLTNWSNGKPIEKEATPPVLLEKLNPPEVKKTKKKEKWKFDNGKEQMVSRLSGSSSGADVPNSLNIPSAQVSSARKHGVLGLGFPSALRFGTVRSSSAGSSDRCTAGSASSLSLDGRSRFSSTISAATSLRPRSTKLHTSSSGSSSVQRAEDCLETVTVARRRELTAERRDEAHCESAGTPSRDTNGDMFPEQRSRPVSAKSPSESSAPAPSRTVKGASVAGHSIPKSEHIVTPHRQARVRPASDQMIGKGRLNGIRNDTDGKLRMIHV